MASQEERQRKVASSNPPLTIFQLAFAIRLHLSKANYDKGTVKNTKNDRTICSRYGIVGQIRDPCYKIHGYPPNYKKQPSLVSVHLVDAKPSDASNLLLTAA